MIFWLFLGENMTLFFGSGRSLTLITRFWLGRLLLERLEMGAGLESEGGFEEIWALFSAISWVLFFWFVAWLMGVEGAGWRGLVVGMWRLLGRVVQVPINTYYLNL